MQQPNELEELALSYLGIEKVYGKFFDGILYSECCSDNLLNIGFITGA